jgi:hypothetical protein
MFPKFTYRRPSPRSIGAAVSVFGALASDTPEISSAEALSKDCLVFPIRLAGYIVYISPEDLRPSVVNLGPKHLYEGIAVVTTW